MAGALILHDVDRARRRIDAGAGTHPPLPERHAGSGNHCIGFNDPGARRRGGSHRGDAHGHRRDRHRGLPQL